MSERTDPDDVLRLVVDERSERPQVDRVCVADRAEVRLR
jgi:hypothetical protein